MERSGTKHDSGSLHTKELTAVAVAVAIAILPPSNDSSHDTSVKHVTKDIAGFRKRHLNVQKVTGSQANYNGNWVLFELFRIDIYVK